MEFSVAQEPGFAVVDVETTGLFPARGDRVVEIAVVRVGESGNLIDEWTTLVNPGRAVGASSIHGITSADVRRAPSFAEILGLLNERLTGRALVAHNALFDLTFMELEYARAGWELPNAPRLCTLEVSHVYLPGLSRRRLAACCVAAGIVIDDAHTALGDARATAALLRHYLAAGARRSPLPDHMDLPRRASTISWPVIARLPNAAPVTRAAGTRKAVPAPPGTLARLLGGLSLPADPAVAMTPATSGYLELLARVLEDGVLTDAEVCELVDFARRYSLSGKQLKVAHRAFLLELAHRAIEDGRVTAAERRELFATAEALGFGSHIVRDVLVDARARAGEALGATCRALPATWDLGEPLRIGDGVAFTGCDEMERARLEGRAQAVGLRVTDAVSRKTAVLVTDGADPTTTKARKAKELGTRVVTPDEFVKLLEYIQPAHPRGASRRSKSRNQPAREPEVVSGPSQASSRAEPSQLESMGDIGFREHVRKAAECIRASKLLDAAMEFCDGSEELEPLQTLAAEHAEYLASLPREVVATAESSVRTEDEEAARRCEEEEQVFQAELETIHRAMDDHHARVRADRSAGIVETQTQLGQRYGVSALVVGRILDSLGLRERIEVEIQGTPPDLRLKDAVTPPLLGTSFVRKEGGPFQMVRGVVDGFAVHDPFDGRDYWVVSKVAPLIESHLSGHGQSETDGASGR